MNHFDIAIIGGGPAGYTAAEKAGNSGLKTILFEKSNLGGVCLNEGCIPTKTLLYSAKMLDQAKDASKYAIEVDNCSFNLKKLNSRKKKIIRKLVLGVKAKVNNAGVTVIEGEAKIENNHTLTCNNETYTFDKLIISTGSSTFIPPISGLDKVNYWTHAEALELSEVPESLAVIGGGVIGLEFASVYNSLGSKVTVIEMLDEILPSFDKETVENLRNEYAKKGIDFKTSTKVESVIENADHSVNITINKDGENSVITSSKLLISVGRKPNTQGFGLESLNLTTNEKGQYIVNNKLQTSLDNIYICGDANGKSLLAHTAIREAEVAIHHILKIEDSMTYNIIPSIVYTNPEIASVGKTEEELLKEGATFEKRVIPMTFSGRFVAENEGINGICKLLYNKESQKIEGIHLVGNPASEIITTAAMAIQGGLSLSDWNKIIFPHPTVTEVLKDLL